VLGKFSTNMSNLLKVQMTIAQNFLSTGKLIAGMPASRKPERQGANASSHACQLHPRDDDAGRRVEELVYFNLHIFEVQPSNT